MMGMHLDLNDVANGNPEAEKELAEIRELLADWLKFASDVQPGCAAGADWLNSLRHCTRKHAPPNAELTGADRQAKEQE